MLNVLLDHLFIQTESGGEISDAPNIAIDVHIANEAKVLLEMGAEIGLKNLHDLGNSNIWRNLYLQVQVIFIDIQGMDVKRRIFLCNRVTRSNEDILHVGFQKFAAVFCTPDNVILVLICTVIQALNSHAGIVARLRRPTIEGQFIPAFDRRGTAPNGAASSCGVSLNANNAEWGNPLGTLIPFFRPRPVRSTDDLLLAMQTNGVHPRETRTDPSSTYGCSLRGTDPENVESAANPPMRCTNPSLGLQTAKG